MSRSSVFGSNQTTPGAASAPSTLLTDTSTTTGLLLKKGSGAPAGQKAWQILHADGTVILEHDWTHFHTYNMKLGEGFGFVTGVVLNGQESPPCLELPDGISVSTAAVTRYWAGTGAPSATTVGNARVGDRYYRKDGGAGTYYYACTVAGAPGTWAAIL